MRETLLTIAAIGLFLPMNIFAQENAEGPAETTHMTGLESLCKELVFHTQEIDKVLLSVIDRPSADAAAKAMEGHHNAISNILKQIVEHESPSSEEAAILVTYLETVLHVTQSYKVTIDNLLKVNAYGSEALMKHLLRYKEATNDRFQTTVSRLIVIR